MMYKIVCKTLMVLSIVGILVCAKDEVLYLLELLSRDSIFNYIINRKTLINTLFCSQTEWRVYVPYKQQVTSYNALVL